jgi:hypothetical protein
MGSLLDQVLQEVADSKHDAAWVDEILDQLFEENRDEIPWNDAS